MKSFKQILETVYLEEAYLDKRSKDIHGPLMNASSWVGKRKLKDLANHPEINTKDGKNHSTMYVGHITDRWSSNPDKKKHVALLSSGEPQENQMKHGYNKPHDWFEDTGNGHKQHASQLTVTGHVHIHPDGKVTTHGDIDMEKSHNLMVYK